MDAMPTTTPAHARPARRDHLWVLAVIAICALAEVWVSWVTIGSMSGFPKIGGAHGLPTAWTLAVTSEAYWGYALYAWLAGAPGPRSRRFAMWSFAVVFVLSLIGQGASHLVPQGTVPPPEVVVFITSLPVVVLALIAVLVHLRQLDREESAGAERQDAKDAEIAGLRAELAAEREALAPLREALAAMETERNEIAAKAETATRKLEAATARKRRTATARKSPRATARKPEPVTGSATAPEAAGVTVPDEAPADLDSEAKVLWYLDKGYSASKAGLAAGLTDSRGRQIARDLAKAAPRGQDPEQ